MGGVIRLINIGYINFLNTQQYVLIFRHRNNRPAKRLECACNRLKQLAKNGSDWLDIMR